MKNALARGFMKYSQAYRFGKAVSLIESLFKYKAVYYLLIAILGCYIGMQVAISPFIPIVLILLIFSVLLFLHAPRWIAYMSFILIPFHWLMLYEGRLTILKLFILGGSLFALSIVLLKKRKITWDPIYSFFWGYFFILFLSTIFHGIRFDSQRYIFEANIFFYFLLPFLIVFFLRTNSDLTLFVKIILIVGVLQATLALLQLYFGDVFNPERYFGYRAHLHLENPIPGYNIVGEVLSPIGTFIRRGDLGLFLLLPFSLGLSFLLSKRTLFSKKILLAFSIIIGTGILSSLSRTSILLMPLSTFIVWLLFKKYTIKQIPLLKIILLSSLIIGLVVFTVPILIQLIEARFGGFGLGIVEEYKLTRYAYSLIALRVFLENPLIGVGAGNFSFYSPLYISKFGETLEAWSYKDYIEAHNAYIELLAEAGLLGFLFWFLIILFSFRYLTKALRTLKGSEDSFHRSAIVGFLTFYILYLLTFITGQSIILAYPLLAIPISISIIYKSYTKRSDNSNFKSNAYLKSL